MNDKRYINSIIGMKLCLVLWKINKQDNIKDSLLLREGNAV